jgi:nucleoside-diphosphate-sugar epimerase
VRGIDVLLTGGTGFVGGHLAEALLAEGARVRCLVREGSACRALAEAGAELCFGSLDDPASLRRACEGRAIIFHLAGATKVWREEDFFRVNVDGTRRLVEAAGAGRDRPRFVHVSSLAACGPSLTGAPLVELDPPRPVSAYGMSKLAGEEIVRRAGLPSVIVRPPAVYGPRDRDVFWFFRLAAWRVAPRIGHAGRIMSLIYVKDLVAGLVRAAKAPPGSTFFMSDPEPHPWDQVIRIIGNALGRRVFRLPVPLILARLAALASEWIGRLTRTPVIFNRDKVRELSFPHWVCSGARAEKELGFVPAYSLRRGVAETVAWYREAGWL